MEYKVIIPEQSTNVNLRYKVRQRSPNVCSFEIIQVIMCGFGVHLEKRPNRLEMIEQFSKQSIQDYILRGGGFDEDGLWKPMNGGLGYWFILQYLNVHGNTKIYIPNYEKYEREYGNEMTKKYLQ